MRDTFLTDFCKTIVTRSPSNLMGSCRNEICSRLSEKRRQGFLSPRSSKITVTKKKERRKRESEEKEMRRRKKAMVALLVFIIATLEIKTVGRKRSIWR